MCKEIETIIRKGNRRFCIPTSVNIYIYRYIYISNDTSELGIDNLLRLEIQKALETSKDKFGSMTWNKTFHTILVEWSLLTLFDLKKFPQSYQPGKVCGHSLQVDLDRVRYNTIHLTLLDLTNSKNNNTRDYMDFIDAVLFDNPLRDVGLQHKLMEKNTEKIYIKIIENYTAQCVCHCSILFNKWYVRLGIDKYNQFKPYDNIIYDDHINFVYHVHENQNDRFHKIIQQIIQTSYSILLNKLNLQSDNDVNDSKSFQENKSGV